MTIIQPNLNWYTEVSASKSLPSRCPFASVHRCPRYYASISLLGEAGVAASIEPEEDERLLDKWKHSDLWPATPEQDACIAGGSHFFNFCPEVSFDRFGWFVSHLSYHTDELDAEVAHKNLADEGASAHDWRWHWSLATPMHYSNCPLYSPLRLGSNEIKKKAKLGFGS